MNTMNVAITIVYHKNIDRISLQQMAFTEAQNKAREQDRQISHQISSEPVKPPAEHEDLHTMKYIFATKEGTAPNEDWSELRHAFKKAINEQTREEH